MVCVAVRCQWWEAVGLDSECSERVQRGTFCHGYSRILAYSSLPGMQIPGQCSHASHWHLLWGKGKGNAVHEPGVMLEYAGG